MPALAAEVDRAGTSKAFLPLSALTENRAENGELAFRPDIFAHTELLAAPVFEAGGDYIEHARTRPNLKVQDGCDNRCSLRDPERPRL